MTRPHATQPDRFSHFRNCALQTRKQSSRNYIVTDIEFSDLRNSRHGADVFESKAMSGSDQ